MIDALAPRFAAVAEKLGDRGQHYREIADCHRLLTENVQKLYTVLELNDQYTAALREGMSFFPTKNQLWCYYLLGESTHIRIGLLSLFSATPVPIHDHPGAFGAQYIVSGKVQISQYDIVEDSASGAQTVVTLAEYGKDELSVGGCSTFIPDNRNIHGLVSLTPRCVILSLKIHPYPEPQRHWYYLADLFSRSKCRIYTRVKRRGRITSQ